MTVTSRASRTPIPAVFADAASAYEPVGGTTIADELTAYQVHLEAENKARATVSLWTGAARQLHAYLDDHGMPTAVRAIRREHIEQWLADMLAAGAKPSTVNNRYRSLQPFWKWLQQEGLISESPMRNMRQPAIPDEHHVDVPKAADVERLLAHVAKDKSFVGLRDYAIIRLLIGTGLRRAELAGMTTESVDWAMRTIVVVGKGRKVRTVKIPKNAYL